METDGSRDEAGARRDAVSTSRELLAARRYRDAITTAEQAFITSEQTRQAQHETPSVEECELLLVRMEAERGLGHVSRCRELAFDAAEVARALANGELLARAALGVDSGVLTAVEALFVDARGLELLTEAARAVGDRRCALNARVLIALSRSLLPPDDEAERGVVTRLQHATDALRLARRLSDQRLLAQALANVAFASDDPDSVVGELRGIAADGTDHDVLLWALAVQIDVAMRHADPRLFQLIETLRRLADDVHHPVFRWYASVWSAMGARVHGDLDESERLAAAALALGQELERPNAVAVYLGQVQAIRLDQRKLDELAASTRSFLDSNVLPIGMLVMACDLYAELRDPIATEALFDRATPIVLEGGPPVREAHFPCLLVRPCTLLRRRTEAAKLRDRLRPLADDYPALPPMLISLFPVAYYLALLSATLSRWNEAIAYFDRAERIASRMGARVADAQIRLDHARTVMQMPRHNMLIVRQLLESAAALASSCGLQAVADEARSLVVPEEASGDAEQLSAREREVSRLVASGMRNQEIAQRLHLSTRTVEAHVQRIRDKLALNSRAALAAWAIQQGLWDSGTSSNRR